MDGTVVSTDRVTRKIISCNHSFTILYSILPYLTNSKSNTILHEFTNQWSHSDVIALKVSFAAERKLKLMADSDKSVF